MGEKLCELLEHDGKTHRGWTFWCPACACAHQVDNRWGFNGDKERPTFDGSVLVHAVTHGTPEAPVLRPRCHSQVTLGKISYYQDCDHDKTMQTLDLPDWDERYKREELHPTHEEKVTVPPTSLEMLKQMKEALKR